MAKKKSKGAFRTSEVVFLVVITCVLSFFMATLIHKNKNVTIYKESIDAELIYFLEQYENIKNNYYQQVDVDSLVDGAIKGMIESLDDPYSTYFSAEEARNFNIKLDGEYEGLGIEIINNENNKIEIYNIFENSSAAKAGLNVGDVITSIDNISTLSMSTEELANYISRNNDFFISVDRNGKSLDFKLSKSKTTIQSVTSELMEQNNKKIGYLKMDIFALNTYEQFKNNLEKLENKNIEYLIVDLRDNSGGHLSTAESILSLFMDSNKVIYQIKQNDKIEKFYSKGNKNKQYNIIVLVNYNSASASEVVAAALKEQLNATIVGNRTLGKGTAQELVTLSSGEQYKFTTKEWLTPNGNSINGNGINPDIIVGNDESYLQKALEIVD